MLICNLTPLITAVWQCSGSYCPLNCYSALQSFPFITMMVRKKRVTIGRSYFCRVSVLFTASEIRAWSVSPWFCQRELKQSARDRANGSSVSVALAHSHAQLHRQVGFEPLLKISQTGATIQKALKRVAEGIWAPTLLNPQLEALALLLDLPTTTCHLEALSG